MKTMFIPQKPSFLLVTTLFFIYQNFLGFAQGSQTFGDGGANPDKTAGVHTFIAPVGVTSVKVTVRGGGGGGGANFTTADGVGGGGGGGIAIINSYPVTAGLAYNLFVGDIGAAGVGGSNGGNGGQSWFINSSTVFANGGIGGLGKQPGGVAGTGGIGGTAGGALANIFFTGGKGGDGNTNSTTGSGGGGGSSAGTSSNGNNGGNGADDLINGGAGGIAPTGGFAGGLGGLGGNGSGSNGKAPGGGGGGTSNIPPNGNIPIGGIGGLGQVVLEWTCPTAFISLPPIICKDVISILPTFSGSLGGIYSADKPGLSINSVTGEINATTSTAGSYKVTYLIASDRGCPTVNPNASIIINPTVTATLTSQVNILCKGASTGSVVITPGGGVIQGGVTPVYSISPSQTGLNAGLKTFTVTDARGCTATTSTTITEPSTALVAQESHINIPCFGAGAIGSATISAIGGTAPYTGTGVFTNLSVGLHTFTVTDANNCTAQAIVNITEPPAALTANITNQVNILCKGDATGSVVIIPSGGTSPYNISPSQNGLTAGLKTFTITDFNNCTTTLSVTITEPSQNLTASISSQVNVSCFGDATGSVIVSPSGGTAPYSITPSQVGLNAGLKTFTITDANNCTTTVSTTITEPALPLSVVANNQVNVNCKGGATGSVNIVASGGTSPYSISPAQTGLTAGQHTFLVTDAKGCTASISISISEPTDALTASFQSVTNVLCKGTATGSVSIAPLGGTPNYTITPAQVNLTAGLKTFSIVDNNGCTTQLSILITEPVLALSASASNQVNILCKGAATGSVLITPAGGTGPYNISPAQTGLTAGLKTFTITDANNCTTTLSITITEPAEPLSSSIISQTNVLCKSGNTGSVQILPTGGVGPYSISPSQNNLTAGNKTFTITDANGCAFLQNVLITEPANPLSASIQSQTNVSCFGGTNGEVVIVPAGGTAPYTISPLQTSLAAGNYTFTITDFNSCSFSVSATITQPSPINISNTLVYIPINSSALLSASCGTLTTKWYDATGANLLFTGQNFTTNQLNQNTGFKVRCENVDCVNSFVDVTVKIGIISLKIGNWEDPTAWSANRIPTSTDDVVIDTGHTISVNSANANAKKLHFNLNGNLKFANATSKLILFQ